MRSLCSISYAFAISSDRALTGLHFKDLVTSEGKAAAVPAHDVPVLVHNDGIGAWVVQRVLVGCPMSQVEVDGM